MAGGSSKWSKAARAARAGGGSPRSPRSPRRRPPPQPDQDAEPLSELDLGVPVRRKVDGALGLVCRGPLTRPITSARRSVAIVQLLLEDGSTSEWIKASELAKPREDEVAALNASMERRRQRYGVADVMLDALAQPDAEADVAAPADALGAPVRHNTDHGTGVLGVVCTEPDGDGDVKLLREDGSITGHIHTSALLSPTKQELAEAQWLVQASHVLTAASARGGWVGMPVRRKKGGAIGLVVSQGPDRDGELKLLCEDGTITGWMRITDLAKPSAGQLAVNADWLDAATATLAVAGGASPFAS